MRLIYYKNKRTVLKNIKIEFKNTVYKKMFPFCTILKLNISFMKIL